MSAILSADDLNDFISPGVACIKPVETLPKQKPEEPSDSYEVTTEEQAAAIAKDAGPAQISLTDCLACSGCVTSAEAVLISLQSHAEVLATLDQSTSISFDATGRAVGDGKLFVATISPQARASLAATYGVTESEAGNMIEQLLCGSQGLSSTATNGSSFAWVLDSNVFRDLCQVASLEEVAEALNPNTLRSNQTNGQSSDKPRLPILASSCPGWICYAEKTHPHILPHLSRLKSPQAMAGTLLKSVLSQRHGIPVDKVWHLAIMPCFDKKLEASREELTDTFWKGESRQKQGIRDVDCVITARELLMLADTRGVSFPKMPRTPLDQSEKQSFPDVELNKFLFQGNKRHDQGQDAGPSGGYAYQILRSYARQHPGSIIKAERGRNVDVVEYILKNGDSTIMKTARYYGFRNIQNLVRRLKPAKTSRLPGSRLATRATAAANGASSGALSEYVYVEVMACPGGCTNGGGQIKASDLDSLNSVLTTTGKSGAAEQKEWLAKIDEAYYSADSSSDDDTDAMDIDGAPGLVRDKRTAYVKRVMQYWADAVDEPLSRLILTSYREVHSDVGKKEASKTSDTERVAGLASSLGGGW